MVAVVARPLPRPPRARRARRRASARRGARRPRACPPRARAGSRSTGCGRSALFALDRRRARLDLAPGRRRSAPATRCSSRSRGASREAAVTGDRGARRRPLLRRALLGVRAAQARPHPGPQPRPDAGRPPAAASTAAAGRAAQPACARLRSFANSRQPRVFAICVGGQPRAARGRDRRSACSPSVPTPWASVLSDDRHPGLGREPRVVLGEVAAVRVAVDLEHRPVLAPRPRRSARRRCRRARGAGSGGRSGGRCSRRAGSRSRPPRARSSPSR